MYVRSNTFHAGGRLFLSSVVITEFSFEGSDTFYILN